MDACKACARNFARSDRSVLCSGSCGRVFHAGCVGLNVTNFKSWAANVGLLWFCENCRVNFNPSIMDRESVILKTMRDLLLRVDSMDLRVGQFGENLKTLNSLLSISSSMRRDSNFSSRLQQFAKSGTTVYDPTDFHNSIDRLNLDLSLRSNLANNTILDENDDLNETMNNDDARNSRQVDVSQRLPNAPTSGTVPTTATTFAISPTTATVTTSASHVTPTTTIASAATTITTFANVVSRTATSAAADAAAAAAAAAAAVPVCTSNNRQVPMTATTSTSNNAGILSRATTYNAQRSGSMSVAAGLQPNSGANECRLKVVNRNRGPIRPPPNDELLKSYYITPFQVEQSEEDIIEYLRENINIENSTLRCVKLVPRNKTINDLSFVSFKLSVSNDLVSVVNDPFYWPEGVEIREFQPKNVNQPSQTILN